MKNLRNNKGFTLIELMIVVVIIGILAAIAIPKFNQVSRNAKQAEAGPILKQICSLATTFKDQKGDAAYADVDLDGLDMVGWNAETATNAKYFDFSFSGGVATASPNADSGDQVGEQTMDCSTGVISDPVAAGA